MDRFEQEKNDDDLEEFLRELELPEETAVQKTIRDYPWLKGYEEYMEQVIKARTPTGMPYVRFKKHEDQIRWIGRLVIGTALLGGR
jgi:hypothetical protein